MRKLVTDHAFKLDLVDDLEKSRCGAYDGMVLVASGRECVRSGILHDVDLRHRESCGDREVLDCGVEVKELRAACRTRASELEDDLVRVPVRYDLEHDRECREDDQDIGILEIVGKEISEQDDDDEYRHHQQPCLGDIL